MPTYAEICILVQTFCPLAPCQQRHCVLTAVRDECLGSTGEIHLSLILINIWYHDHVLHLLTTYEVNTNHVLFCVGWRYKDIGNMINKSILSSQQNKPRQSNVWYKQFCDSEDHMKNILLLKVPHDTSLHYTILITNHWQNQIKYLTFVAEWQTSYWNTWC